MARLAKVSCAAARRCGQVSVGLDGTEQQIPVPGILCVNRSSFLASRLTRRGLVGVRTGR